MKDTAILAQDPATAYAQAVDALFEEQFQTNAAGLIAESVVTAAWRAGYTPQECVTWLAEIDGLG